MYIKNRKISFIYKLIAILFCITGQVLALGILNGEFKATQFLYYTNQSNILCMVYFICAAVFVYKQIKKDGKYGAATFSPRFKGAVLMAITVTFLIFWLLLNSASFDMDASADSDSAFQFSNLWPLTNQIVHMIVPLLTIFDWVLFDPKGSFKKFDPFIWLCIPFVYYAFALVVAQTGYTFFTGSRYPYFFIDSDVLGWGTVFLYVAGLTLGFLILGYLVLGLDKLLSKHT